MKKKNHRIKYSKYLIIIINQINSADSKLGPTFNQNGKNKTAVFSRTTLYCLPHNKKYRKTIEKKQFVLLGVWV